MLWKEKQWILCPSDDKPYTVCLIMGTTIMLLKFHDLAIQKAILAYDCETKVHARSKSIVLQLDPGTCMVIKNPAGMCRHLKYFCYKSR